MQADLDRAYKQNLGEPAQPPSKEEVAIQRLNLLKNLITEEILQQRAAKLNLIATDEEVDSKLHDMKALATDEEFNRQLKEKNLTIDDLKRDIRRELTKTKLINKEIESKINITESEISNYYSAHKSEFNLIEPQYHLEQIVVTNKPSKQVTNLQNSKASNDEEAKKKMQQLKGRLDTGEDFASVAQRYSEDPATSSNGGDLGFIQESSLQSDPDAFAAVSKLKAGQLTDALTVYSGEGSNRKALGYVIYRLVEKQPAGQWEMNDPARPVPHSSTAAQQPRPATPKCIHRNALQRHQDSQLPRRRDSQERRPVSRVIRAFRPSPPRRAAT